MNNLILLNKIIPVSVFISLFLFICFPQITFLGSNLYNLFAYLNVIVAFILHNKSKNNVFIVKLINRILLTFVILSIFGNVISILLYNVKFYSSGIKDVLLTVFYGYSFAILAINKKVQSAIKYCVYISSVIVSLYGIYCYITDSNPYMTFISTFYGNTDYTVASLIEVRGLKGRVGGHLGNPVFLGGELLVLLGYCLVDISLEKTLTKVKLFVIYLLLITTVLTGSRSAMFPSFALILFAFYLKYKWKSLLALSCIVLLAMPFIPNIDDFIASLNIFIDSENVRGSSISMRESQYNGLRQIVNGRDWFGNGLGWIRHYIDLHGPHPVLLGFESLIFSSFTEGGYWRLLIVYPLFFYSLFKVSLHCKQTIIPFYLIAYLSYAIITGAFSFNIFISLFISIIVGIAISSNIHASKNLLNRKN